MVGGNAKDVAAGLIFVAVGLAFGSMATGLDLGTARHMGPGYFPLFLAAILVILGIAIAWQGLRRPAEAIGGMPWRGLVLVVATPILFGLTLRGVGLVPAIVGVVLISAAASVMSRLLPTVVLAVGLTVFCALVFIKGLGLPIALFGPWVTFAHSPPAAVEPAPASAPPAASGG